MDVLRALDMTQSDERWWVLEPAALTGRVEEVDFSLTEGDELRGVLSPLCRDEPESERSMALLLLWAYGLFPRDGLRKSTLGAGELERIMGLTISERVRLSCWRSFLTAETGNCASEAERIGRSQTGDCASWIILGRPAET